MIINKREIFRLSRRFLNLQEFQSKELMNKFGLNTQKFKIIKNVSEAEKAVNDLKAAEYVIKAQILAGGRGKGTFSSGLKGGVQLTKDGRIVEELVKQMLGYKLVTQQTRPEGSIVKEVMLAEAKDLVKETYVAVLLDRKLGGACLVVSSRGGVDIEELAERDPDAIKKLPLSGCEVEDEIAFDKAARFLFPTESESVRIQARSQLKNLFNLFKSVDATMVEINPFGLTLQNEVLCFDAKLEFDENAAYRQKEVFQMAIADVEDIYSGVNFERLARDHGLNYVKMDGSIGCLVNGAGLAMATMDLISLKGGKPANFLDVGGGASASQIKTALEILLQDPSVSSILINIFGGIMRCDVIAVGIIAATREIDLNKPMIVRLSGTNANLGMKMLEESGIQMEVCLDAEDAAESAVKASNIQN